MKDSICRWFAMGVTLSVFAVGPLNGAETEPAPAVFKAGFAERDITPKLGMEQPGGYSKSFHRQFHDACKVRVAVFDDGKSRVALVGIDSLMIPRSLVLAARKEIQAKTGIAPEAVLVGASHSHSSGPVGMVQPGEYDHASKLARYLAYEKSSCADAGYLKTVQDAIVEGVVEADKGKQEARCGVGSGHEDKVAFNRRFFMKGGLTFTHPGKGNPDIEKVAGPIDPEVGVIGAWDKSGNLIGCVVNYACHATTNPGGISANWIYDLEKTIRGSMGEKAVVVFLQGASGDITQVDNLNPYQNPTTEQWCRMVGGRIGAEAVKTLLIMETGALLPLDAKAKVFTIKRRVPSPERLESSIKLAKEDPSKVDPTEWTFAKEIVMLDALLEKERAVEVEVQAIQVGPALFVTNPAEYFCQFGLDIKSQSPFKFTYPVELANGCVGYVPTEEALGERGGGYETRLTSYSNLEPSAGRQMVEAALELANKMKPGKLPGPSGKPIQGKPWNYGNVPPEVQ